MEALNKLPELAQTQVQRNILPESLGSDPLPSIGPEVPFPGCYVTELESCGSSNHAMLHSEKSKE